MSLSYATAQAYKILFLQAGDKPQPKGWLARLESWLRPPFGVPTPPGQLVLNDLAWRACMYDPTTRFDNAGRVDAIQTARMEGKRELFLAILTYLNLDPNTLLQNEGEPDHE
jgi:hypothetical protein